MKDPKKYTYVGSKEILNSVDLTLTGYPINAVEDVTNWIKENQQELTDSSIIVTFIIDEAGTLLINDRHSEHVMCAGGQAVLSAGEMTFYLDKNETFITEISNQSTGYCPEPNSWTSVAKALQAIKIEHPDYFTQSYDFRYCFNCENINLVKESLFECVICGEALDLEWNFS